MENEGNKIKPKAGRWVPDNPIARQQQLSGDVMVTRMEFDLHLASAAAASARGEHQFAEQCVDKALACFDRMKAIQSEMDSILQAVETMMREQAMGARSRVVRPFPPA